MSVGCLSIEAALIRFDLEKITFREGFGDVLANGWQGLIRAFGADLVKDRSTIIKGREGVWDPRLSGTNEFVSWSIPEVQMPNAADRVCTRWDSLSKP